LKVFDLLHRPGKNLQNLPTSPVIKIQMKSYFLNLPMFLIVILGLNLALLSSGFGFRDRDWDFRKITITYPEGGEKFVAGSKQKISWQTSSSIRYVKIEYSIDNGKNWIEIVKSMKMDEPFASYEWEVDCTPTSEAKIRITDAYGPDYDVLIKPFSILCNRD
jgi:hypothetical protein